MMGLLIRRQYSTYARTLISDLGRNPIWRRNAIQQRPPRLAPLTLFSLTGTHSGAQRRVRIAARDLFLPDVDISAHLPSRFAEMTIAADAESPIYIYELAATALTACAVAYRSDGNHRSCALCIDNKAALESLTKGSPPSPMGAIW